MNSLNNLNNPTLTNHKPISLTKPSPIATTSRQLHVELVDPINYPQVQKIAEEWEEIATTKEKNATGFEAQRLRSCASIAYQIQRKTTTSGGILGKYLQKFQKRPVFYACLDNTGKTQALSVVKIHPPALKVEYLVTNPANIRCKENLSDPNRVEGAGRTFCEFVNQEAPKKGIRYIKLVSLLSAEEFYIKSGFRKNSDGMMVKSIPEISSKL